MTKSIIEQILDLPLETAVLMAGGNTDILYRTGDNGWKTLGRATSRGGEAGRYLHRREVEALLLKFQARGYRFHVLATGEALIGPAPSRWTDGDIVRFYDGGKPQAIWTRHDGLWFTPASPLGIADREIDAVVSRRRPLLPGDAGRRAEVIREQGL